MGNVTVIVHTMNEADNIGTFLDSIPAKVPIIVVDTGSDDTATIVKQRRPQNGRVVIDSGNPPAARQIGGEAAQTDWLLFTDADVVFAPSYFKHLTKLIWDRAGYDIFYGPKLSGAEYGRYYRFLSSGQQFLDQFGIPAATGSNIVMSRRAFKGSGGFDRSLTCNEDSEIVWRAKRYGYGVRWSPEIMVYAVDHRRLEKGVVRKTVHSLFRCFLLYTDLMPDSWRGRDWGYWSGEGIASSNSHFRRR